MSKNKIKEEQYIKKKPANSKSMFLISSDKQTFNKTKKIIKIVIICAKKQTYSLRTFFPFKHIIINDTNKEKKKS